MSFSKEFPMVYLCEGRRTNNSDFSLGTNRKMEIINGHLHSLTLKKYT